MSADDHPPIANRVVAIDFDGTITKWGPLMDEDAVAFDGVAIMMQRLRDAGYRIPILTSRLSETWARSEVGHHKWEVARFLDYQRAHVAHVLDRSGVPYDDITAEKVPAEAYFDDKAWTAGHGSLPNAIARFLRGNGVAA